MNLENLIQYASDELMSTGKVVPCLFLEFAGKKNLCAHVLPLECLETAKTLPEQCGMIGRIVLEHYRKHLDLSPLSASLIARACLASDDDPTMLHVPAREWTGNEVLTVQYYQFPEKRSTSLLFPVSRSEKDGIMLGERQEASKFSPQFGIVIEAIHDAPLSDLEIIEKRRASMREGLGHLSTEKRLQFFQELARLAPASYVQRFLQELHES